jgi:NDP-sugar pyrophosphorylase family protein
MKAMILAAGLGTRLRPLTDHRPKALVEVAGRTMLEIALDRLRAFGVSEVIVNAHHYADMIVEFLQAKNNFGIRIEVSREESLLDTGGGLKRAAWFFLEDGAEARTPFIVHNVDVIGNIDLGSMMKFQMQHDALATLAVQDRATSRYLLFDEHELLCGRRTAAAERTRDEWARPGEPAQPLAFCGIHVLSPRIFAMMEEEGAFSIIDCYLRLAAQGEKIAAYRGDGCYWRDLGRPESIMEASREFSNGKEKDNGLV